MRPSNTSTLANRREAVLARNSPHYEELGAARKQGSKYLPVNHGSYWRKLRRWPVFKAPNT